MQPHIEYFMTPNSPWTYLGHGRLMSIANRYSAQVSVKPCDFATIFNASGGLPLAQRAPQRQAYRLTELARFRDYLGLPLNLHPRYFPVATDLSSRFIIAAVQTNAQLDVLRLAGAIGHATWVAEKDIADGPTLVALANDIGLDGSGLLESSSSPEIFNLLAKNTEDAIAKGAFGAPTYAVGGELFWGQDRLEFLERALAGQRHV